MGHLLESCGDSSGFVGGGSDSGEGIAGVVEMLAGSVKRHARALWLCSLNRWYAVRPPGPSGRKTKGRFKIHKMHYVVD
jgi:hypothetical protein